MWRRNVTSRFCQCQLARMSYQLSLISKLQSLLPSDLFVVPERSTPLRVHRSPPFGGPHFFFFFGWASAGYMPPPPGSWLPSSRCAALWARRGEVLGGAGSEESGPAAMTYAASGKPRRAAVLGAALSPQVPPAHTRVLSGAAAVTDLPSTHGASFWWQAVPCGRMRQALACCYNHKGASCISQCMNGRMPLLGLSNSLRACALR